jgi:DNA-binding NtrC family response regulator
MNTHSNQNNSLSIIVIEDNRGDFILVEDYLIENYKEIKVEQCTSFESAKIYLQNKNNLCDLIFLDLNVTDMEGLELVKSMATLSAKIPIIILTGYADLPCKKSLELGIYDFLIKDEINPTLLHKSIEFAISRSKYVHEIESQYEKLRKIAWTQSHVVKHH